MAHRDPSFVLKALPLRSALSRPRRRPRLLPRWVGAFLVTAAVAVSGRATAPARVFGGALTAEEVAQGYRDGVVIAKPRPELVPSIDQAERAEGMTVWARYGRFGNLGVLRLVPGDSVPAAVQRLKATG